MTRFIADSCSDMLQMEGVDFVAVPLTISTDVKDYVDDENLDVKGMTEDLAGYKRKIMYSLSRSGKLAEGI